MSPINLPKIYNPALQSRQELIDNFVVRTRLFDEIFNDIKASKMVHPEQHYIIQGNRGQGKTTLLLRIAYEIAKDPELNQWLVPVIFNEEQYSITRLFKLWEAIAEYLDHETELTGVYEKMERFDFDDDYESKCFELLEQVMIQKKRKLILFMDNIDEMFDKLTKKEQHRLREIFTESSQIRVIGASSVSLEFHHDHGKPFYQFFRMPNLKGLNSEETRDLLLGLGRHYKKDKVEEIIKRQPGRIEALRRLTGGVIRTIIILFEIFIDDENGSAFKDLEKILDTVTPLYKHRMDKLSPQQQEIVDFIALNWDAVTVKEISARTRIQSKAVSAQLGQLEKFHIIEKEKTTTKNYLYRVQERFFNIWYLMRLGRKGDERRVRFLVEFLQIWCDETDLENRAYRHLDAIKKGRIMDRHALLMTEAFLQTGLKEELKTDLLKTTKSYLDKKSSLTSEAFAIPDKNQIEDGVESSETESIDQKIALIEKNQNKTFDEFNMLGLYYTLSKKDIAKAEKYFLKAVEKGHAGAMNNLAGLYKTEYKDSRKAEEYLLKAIEKGHVGAMINLAVLYEKEYKNYRKAKNYYLMAVEKGDADAMFGLAFMHDTELRDKSKAENYYLMAVEKGHVGAMNNLAVLYQTQYKDNSKAKKYYLKAIEKGHVDAMNNLAGLYKTVYKNSRKAEGYYLKAIEKGDADAMLGLALLHDTEFKDKSKAEKYYLMAAEEGNADAMNNLAWLYKTEYKDNSRAEEFLLKAVEKGHAGAMYNLAVMYETEYKNHSKAEKYYLMAVEKGDAEAMNNLALLYQTRYKDISKAEEYLLKAVEKGHAGAMYNMALLYQTEYKDISKAEEYLLKAVEKGHADAMLGLALLHDTEFKDKSKAEKYYLMAAEEGNADAMNNLAWLYKTEYKDNSRAEEFLLKAVEKGHAGAMYNLAVMYETEYKNHSKAEKYYLMAVEKGDAEAMNNLALLYQTRYKDISKAEEYFLKAVEKGHAGAMYNMALLYQTEYKDISKAEEYLLKAVEKGHADAMNNLAYLYFEKKKNMGKSLELSENAYQIDKHSMNAHTYAMILLWDGNLEKSIEAAGDFLSDEDFLNNYAADAGLFLMFLIAKNQYHLTLNLFNENPNNLKDRFKPVYYALMSFMRDQYPNEYLKMGEELRETVDEVLVKIDALKKKYG